MNTRGGRCSTSREAHGSVAVIEVAGRGERIEAAQAGYPNGFDAGEMYPWPRTMERAAFAAALASRVGAVYGNAASRIAETVPSDGAFAGAR